MQALEKYPCLAACASKRRQPSLDDTHAVVARPKWAREQGLHTGLQSLKCNEDRTGQDRTGQDRTGQDRTGQDRTGQDRTGQDRTGQDRTGQDRTGQDRTGQDRTGQDRTGQDRTGQDRWNSVLRISSQFLSKSVKECFPHCHVAFIPGGHTAHAQPLDVAFHGPLKALLRRKASEYFAREVVRFLREGEQFTIDLSVGTIRLLMLQWLSQGLEDVGSRQQLHAAAWSMHTDNTDADWYSTRNAAHAAHKAGTLFSSDVFPEEPPVGRRDGGR